MPNYRLDLCYDGSNYNGWQKQGNTEKTIQGRLEAALCSLLQEPVEVSASGRTDAGVHALHQVCSFRSAKQIDSIEFLPMLQNSLPRDIGLLSLSTAEPRFHARLSCRAKTYEYHLWNNTTPNVFRRRYSVTIPEALDLSSMKEASRLLLGEHDFAAFCTGKPKKSTVRRISDISFRTEGNELILSFTGDGFLYNMVRILTGTLLEVGLGKRSVASVRDALESRNRAAAGFTAPAQGLFLKEVFY